MCIRDSKKIIGGAAVALAALIAVGVHYNCLLYTSLLIFERDVAAPVYPYYISLYFTTAFSQIQAKESGVKTALFCCIPKTTRWASGSKEAAADEEK